MTSDPATQAIVEASARLSALRARIVAGDPWPLADRFDHAPEASWGPPEILAHCLEMVDYWRGELGRVAAGTGSSPVPFGRTATDTDRLAAIERDRHLPSAELLDRLEAGIARALAAAAGWSAAQREQLGSHPSGDVLSVSAGLPRFIGGHLLAHLDQLEATIPAG